MKLVRSFPLQSETIVEIAEQIRQRQRACAELLQQCLKRIDELEAQVHAWVSVDRAGAIDQAHRLDAELATGRWRGPLHGVPIGIKDIVDVAGFPTAAGSPLLKHNNAARDTTIGA